MTTLSPSRRTIRTSFSKAKSSSKSTSPSLILIAGVCFGVACASILLTSAYMALQLDPGAAHKGMRGGTGGESQPKQSAPHSLHTIRAETRNSFAMAQLQAHGEAQQQPPPKITPPEQEPADDPLVNADPEDGPTVVRQQFQQRYGEYADAIREKGLQPFGSMEATAKRLLRAAAAQQPFELAFAGYSITVGRGNYLSQSYPLVLERILQPVLASSPLQLTVSVRNAAIGGIPSFPYGFCLEHFLGPAPDVVSWDYSLNEGKQAAVFEAYLRQSQHQLLASRPMMMALDTNEQRCSTLQQYTALGLVADGLCVGMAKDVLPKDLETKIKDDKTNQDDLPMGLQHWNDFGSPGGCPGRGPWHPKKMEHELIAWMLALYFVDALETAQEMIQKDANWKTTYGGAASSATSRLLVESGGETKAIEFPPTIHTPPADNPADITSLLYGHATDDDKYVLNHISCRTSFLPAVDHDKVIPSIIVSGLSPNALGQDILEMRSDEAYQSGWVLDVSQLERDTKLKVNKCDSTGLGYIDMKIALYGTPESGPLRLWLPLEGVQDRPEGHDPDDSTLARRWFDNLVICEANEKRPEGACALDSDLEYSVGGVAVPSTQMISGAGEYLKRKTCVHVGVPETARVTRLKDLMTAAPDETPVSQETRIRLAGPQGKDDDLGLLVDVKAKSNVSREKGACCLSHIVWEQH